MQIRQEVFTMIKRARKALRKYTNLGLSRYGSRATVNYIFRQSEYSYQPGPFFEERAPAIGLGKIPRAKVIAFFLPQFHEFEENNRNWGKGFTEWTNLPRQLPRFRDHIAPRVPRDLGFYDLLTPGVQEQQARIAKEAGIYGFCYYYYRFNGQGFMDAPLERMLKTPAVDIPFCVMWCNETWTRTWEGRDRAIIAEQKYSEVLDVDLVDDLARLFQDPRYIRVNDRPLWTIYRPSFMPDAAARVGRMRELFASRHGIDPIITMAQTDEGVEPEPFALDGAIEFVANKFKGRVRNALKSATLFDGSSSKSVRDYEHLIELSLAEPVPDYPVARSVMPAWDNNPRRPGRGSVMHGSTPPKFQNWTERMIDYAVAHPFHGEALLFVNAWNEWAESAYLEPDTHFGGAYLNSVARAVFQGSAHPEA
jgi:hypothetical protein